MRYRTFAVAMFSLLFFAGLLVPSLRADEEDKKTIITFSEPVQVPGMTLPAGTYTFKLADSTSDRNIVQIFSADGTRLITTVLAIPDERLAPTGNTVVKFDERPTGQPEALKAWFYPGDNFGQEFVYPKQRATELAQSNKEPVLSVRDNVKDDAMKTAPVEPAQPQPTVVAAAEETQVVDAPIPAPAEQQLPETASEIPTIALLGTLALLFGFGLRRFSLNS
jgi:hypothetical protein